jgi:two-component system sensor histidine kinase YesM
VRDSGSGIPAGELEDLKQELSSWESAGSSHVGLRNVQGRIKLAFGDPYGVYIESEKGSGVAVRIELPYLPLGAEKR